MSKLAEALEQAVTPTPTEDPRQAVTPEAVATVEQAIIELVQIPDAALADPNNAPQVADLILRLIGNPSKAAPEGSSDPEPG